MSRFPDSNLQDDDYSDQPTDRRGLIIEPTDQPVPAATQPAIDGRCQWSTRCQHDLGHAGHHMIMPLDLTALDFMDAAAKPYPAAPTAPAGLREATAAFLREMFRDPEFAITDDGWDNWLKRADRILAAIASPSGGGTNGG